MNPLLRRSKHGRFAGRRGRAGALAALLLLLLLVPPVGNAVRRVFISGVLRPLAVARSHTVGVLQSGAAFFRSKQALTEENAALKLRLAELESVAERLAVLGAEHARLRALVGRIDADETIYAAVLVYPPDLAPDTLVIDAGSVDGVREGMRALAQEGVLLGTVSAVGPHESRVELLSAAGRATNVVLTEAGIPAVAEGFGAGNLRISLPSVLSVSAGVRVVSPESMPLLVGIIEQVLRKETSPTQQLLFRLPVNIRAVRSVMLRRATPGAFTQ